MAGFCLTRTDQLCDLNRTFPTLLGELTLQSIAFIVKYSAEWAPGQAGQEGQGRGCILCRSASGALPAPSPLGLRRLHRAQDRGYHWPTSSGLGGQPVAMGSPCFLVWRLAQGGVTWSCKQPSPAKRNTSGSSRLMASPHRLAKRWRRCRWR